MSDNIADLCTSYREELSIDLQPCDACTACGVKVARHPRDPKLIAAAQAAAAQASATAAAATAAAQLAAPPHLLSASSSASSSFQTAVKSLGSLLPKWSHKTVCRTFLQRTEQVLSTSVANPAEWNKAFVIQFADPSFVSQAQWIQDNIVNKSLTWEQSKKVFSSHFELADFRVTLQAEYDACKQSKGESVQLYADRFSDICSQLGYLDDNELVIHHFVSHLNERLHQRYFDSIGQIQCTDPDFEIRSLTRAIAHCIKLEVSASRAAASRYSNPDGSSSSSSGAAASVANKHCIYHPDSTSHSTANCRAVPASNKLAAAASAPASSDVTSASSVLKTTGNSNVASWHDTATCRVCGQVGHISPNCPMKASAASRHSERQSNPPNRLTYEQKGQPTELKSTAASDSATVSTTIRYLSLCEPAIATPVSCAIPLSQPLSAVQLTSTPIAEVKRYVHFIVNGEVCKALVDPGADVSIINAALVNKLGIVFSAVSGQIRQVSSAAPANRVGVTAPLDVSCVSSMPHVKFRSTDFIHQFEVLPLNCQFDFILGADLILDLIPVNLIGQFIPRCSRSAAATPPPPSEPESVLVAATPPVVVSTSPSLISKGEGDAPASTSTGTSLFVVDDSSASPIAGVAAVDHVVVVAADSLQLPLLLLLLMILLQLQLLLLRFRLVLKLMMIFFFLLLAHLESCPLLLLLVVLVFPSSMLRRRSIWLTLLMFLL